MLISLDINSDRTIVIMLIMLFLSSAYRGVYGADAREISAETCRGHLRIYIILNRRLNSFVFELVPARRRQRISKYYTTNTMVLGACIIRSFDGHGGFRIFFVYIIITFYCRRGARP